MISKIMSAKNTRLLLIFGALLLFVLLFIAPKTIPGGKSGENPSNKVSVKADNNSNLDVYLTMAQKNLEPEAGKKVQKMVKENKNDSLIGFWTGLKRPDLAAVFAEENAKKSGAAKDWFNAGERYYYANQFCKDQTEIPLLYQCAMRCFSRGLKIEPKNADAKILLASCFVEGTEDPMQGITMLREVEKTDSNNVKLQLSFAFFSVKSGQLDRAIERFNKVLMVDSNYIEAYLHLADAYEQQGKTVQTIQALEKYGAKTNDPTARAEINKYIQQLKKENIN
jgi:tetratricopeptide (TPR) repeat protein